MRYTEFRSRIETALVDAPQGLTWKMLRDQLELPYERPCPEWTRRLETEIGLTRERAGGRALVWRIAATH